MKKIQISLLFISVLLLGLSGCAMPTVLNQNRPNTDFMDRWIGLHISGAIQRMGPATQITEDGAGGRIYLWVEHHQKTVHDPYFVVPPQQPTADHTPAPNVSQETTTRGTMRWNPIFDRWEYESKTKPTSRIPRIPDISRTVREADRTEPQPQLRFKKVTKNYTGQVMFYTRSDGTIYHWLIRTPNNHYGYNNRKNAKKSVPRYNNRNLTDKEKNSIRKYDVTISMFPNNADAYFNRGIAKHKLGLIHEAEQDLQAALRIATQQDKINLKNRIKKKLRDLQ